MPQMFTRLVLSSVLLMLAPGCTKKSSDAVLRPVNTLEAQELVQGKRKLLGLAGNAAGVWVDSRPESEYAAGHIPGAINMPYERISLEHRKLRDYELIVVYGSDYNDARANGMSKRLIELGYDNVYTLTGGLRAWKSEGNEVEQSAPTPAR